MEDLESTDSIEVLEQKAEALAMEISQMYVDPEYKDLIRELQVDNESGMLGLNENQAPGGKTGIQIWYEGSLNNAKLQESSVYYQRMLLELQKLKRKLENS
jgi:predicted aminopeptidase